MNTIDQTHPESVKKRPISLTVRTDLIKEARALRLNTSRAAEAGIEAAVKKAKEQAWLSENKAAIEAYNERIARSGTLIKPIWLLD
ncbi:type II toxin-antitoxin system CcdA family antitoxin [Hyphomicrobium sp.]|uniref:type II toxin-antitoxin system CcdA family antitoxin n=1 Tax=Hyphomicrobium sp. TaxID=82 RepID=UPI002E2F0F1F|nr:type II toxin-antitoxin system CcdA family antitoxin [Hyphomicrobium sp.]HEX2839929.1 type II toxin-antitoxin system CcdA family antitoxin [Hyphomicrobium sp.]